MKALRGYGVTIRAISFLVAVGAPGRVAAWDSVCYVPAAGDDVDPNHATTKCASGPDTARHRWIGISDEHRQIFSRAAHLAGIPIPTDAEYDFDEKAAEWKVFTSSQQTLFKSGATDAIQTITTWAPADRVQVERFHTRRMTIAEFAQLPDHSYSLWDWAAGNEQCPPYPGNDAEKCHSFIWHMGPLNSNHFPPQSKDFYARYHGFAMERARLCGKLINTVREANAGNIPESAKPFTDACAYESFVLEAVAQHYLQDTWSEGHMWERWGTPEPGEVPYANSALAAMISGIIHGARAILQPSRLLHLAKDVNDPLCAPGGGVAFIAGADSAMKVHMGLGDLYLDLLATDESFAWQSDKMFECWAAGIADVYQAMSKPYGLAEPQIQIQASPLSDECFGQRATNEAMERGLGLHFIDLFGNPQNWELSHAASVVFQLMGSDGERTELSELDQRASAFQLVKMGTHARLRSADCPYCTDVADQAFDMTFMGVKRNREYANRAIPASWTDPALPWPKTGQGGDIDEAKRSYLLARTFHRAHADDWCRITSSDELDAIRARVHNPTHDADGRIASCEYCKEFVTRHVRLAKSNEDPICAYASSSSAFLDLPDTYGSDIADATKLWCATPPLDIAGVNSDGSLSMKPDNAFTQADLIAFVRMFQQHAAGATADARADLNSSGEVNDGYLSGTVGGADLDGDCSMNVAKRTIEGVEVAFDEAQAGDISVLLYQAYGPEYRGNELERALLLAPLIEAATPHGLKLDSLVLGYPHASPATAHRVGPYGLYGNVWSTFGMSEIGAGLDVKETLSEYDGVCTWTSQPLQSFLAQASVEALPFTYECPVSNHHCMAGAHYIQDLNTSASSLCSTLNDQGSYNLKDNFFGTLSGTGRWFYSSGEELSGPPPNSSQWTNQLEWNFIDQEHGTFGEPDLTAPSTGAPAGRPYPLTPRRLATYQHEWGVSGFLPTGTTEPYPIEEHPEFVQLVDYKQYNQVSATNVPTVTVKWSPAP